MSLGRSLHLVPRFPLPSSTYLKGGWRSPEKFSPGPGGWKCSEVHEPASPPLPTPVLWFLPSAKKLCLRNSPRDHKPRFSPHVPTCSTPPSGTIALLPCGLLRFGTTWAAVGQA